MYGIQNPSALTSQFAEWSGGAMLMIAIASILSLGGMDFTKALAWGSVPTLVQNVQGLLKDSASKLGFGVMAKFMPVHWLSPAPQVGLHIFWSKSTRM